MVYIILGMLGAFVAVFIIIALIPSSAFDWLFKEPTAASSDSDGAGEGQTSSEPEEPQKSRL